MLEKLISPNFPRSAIGFGDDRITALSLRSEGGGSFVVSRAASVDLPPGVVVPGFSETNIYDEGALLNAIDKAVTDSGLRGVRKWSVALPSGAARTAILSISELPASRKELEEVLDFKAEVAFGEPSADLRISRQKISPDGSGRTRYFATAVKLSVIDEYESVFEMLGWQAGLILPKAVCEMNWLSTSSSLGDSMLISSNPNGFTALLLRGNEPAVVRSVSCGAGDLDDEIYRLLVYYQDKYAIESEGNSLRRFLLVGGEDLGERIRSITAEALGEAVSVLRPSDINLSLSGGIGFTDIAAPAGAARLHFR